MSLWPALHLNSENNCCSSNIWLKIYTDKISLIYLQRVIGYKIASSCTWLVMSDERRPTHVEGGGAVDLGWWDLIMLINGLTEEGGGETDMELKDK